MGRNFKLNFITTLLILLLTLNLTLSNPISINNETFSNSISNDSTTLISDHIKDAVDQAIFSKNNLTNIQWEPDPVGNKPPTLHLPNNLTVIIEDNSKVFEEAHQHSVHVVSFKFEYVKAELVLCTFIILIGLFKLIYHEMPFIKDWLPESCCLIALGCAIGGFIRFVAGDESAKAVKFLEFDSKIFFFFLLPPIILEAAYDLNDKAFVNNLGTIILYAVVGTVLNIFIIGGGLILCGWLGFFGTFGIHALDTLIFASLIAAVDPVAVLAIFKEVGVNKVLYFMVFGESLLNDAVTVVCYNLIGEFKNLETIRLYDCFLGFVAFLCVSFGGLIIGLLMGIFSSFITKFTRHVRVVEPVICFGMAYLAYVLSELFHFSGIIGIIACGLFQTHYTMLNLTGKGYISINYIIKFLSSVSESLIFIILGVMLLNENSFFFDDWHPLFAIMALVFCFIARFVVVFFLTWIVNRFTGGVRYINFREQIIMSYGGLRGAVSFSLCFMIDNNVDAKPTLLAATYLVIMFTVFFQGSSMKTLVKMLNITLDHTNNFRLFCEFNKGMINHMTQGVEDLIGYSKNKTFMQKVRHLGSTYLRPYLIRNYTIRKTEDKLMSIENMENLKETLKSVPSQASFQRQQTIDDMAENGQIDAIDECDALMLRNAKDREKEQSEKEINELINDVKQIRALCNDTLYPDRNLIDEELHERRQSLTTPMPSFIKHEVNKVINLNLIDIKNRRGIFGVRPKKKVSVTKGLVSAATPSLGLTSHTNVSNHTVYKDVIDEVDETPDSPISPPATARSRKSLGAIFGDFAAQQPQPPLSPLALHQLQQSPPSPQPQPPPLQQPQPQSQPPPLPTPPPLPQTQSQQLRDRRNSKVKVLFHQEPIDKEPSTEQEEDNFDSNK